MSLAGAYQMNAFATLLAATTIVLSAGYSILLFNRLAFGSFSPYLAYTTDLSRREYMILLTLLIPTIAFAI
jgi:NADH-ubiquinone oxidoreductase chain 4